MIELVVKGDVALERGANYNGSVKLLLLLLSDGPERVLRSEDSRLIYYNN